MATNTTTTTDVDDDDDDDSHSSIQIVSTDVVNISFLQSCWLQNEVLHHVGTDCCRLHLRSIYSIAVVADCCYCPPFSSTPDVI